MALSADMRPHFTTIAAFVSELESEIVALFRDVLLYCEELGLIGKEHFAVDGCKLPSNASKQWSGTHEELRERQKKMEKTARELVGRHRQRDEREEQGPVAEQEEKKLATYREKIRKIKAFLSRAEKNMGPSGNERKRNITDPDSAKMSTAHGVIQGYNGVAVVDERHQIVVHAQALGEGQENHLLEPMVKATRESFEAIGRREDVFAKATLTADSGYHSKQSMEYIANSEVDAYVADREMRRRDPAFANAGRYKERHRKDQRRRHSGSAEPKWFTPGDFVYAEGKQTCICPAGHRLYRSRVDIVTSGYRGAHFKAPKSACGPCELRQQCLRLIPGPNRATASGVLQGAGAWEAPGAEGAAGGDRGDEAQDRQCAGPIDLRQTDRHGGAGVCKHTEQGDAPLHAARPGQGEHAVEAVHAGAQHREDRELRNGVNPEDGRTRAYNCPTKPNRR